MSAGRAPDQPDTGAGEDRLGDTAAALARLPLFASVGPEALATVALGVRREHHAAGSRLFAAQTQATCCYGVVTGVVNLMLTGPDGNEKVVEIIRADETFGEAVMLLGRRFPVAAVADTDVEVLRISSRAVDVLLDTDWRASRAMLASMAIRMHSLVRDIEMYTVQPARDRVVSYILAWARHGGGPVVHFEPSKRAVASRLSMSPETFSRVLHDLVEQGLLERDGTGVRVPDLARLHAASGS